MIADAYRAQVELLLRVLPHVAKENLFALKGGTAINLFVRDMPRLSVDIDLTYLPFDDRATALKNIAAALGRLNTRIKAAIPGIRVIATPQGSSSESKLVCRLNNATVKIEVNQVVRGHLWPVRQVQLTKAAQIEFEMSAAINIVSHAELFGGKICAALDRQHPRDLFDVRQLLLNEGVTDDLRHGFIAMLLSHARPIHEVIRPNFQDQQEVFRRQCEGMTFNRFSYDDYLATRAQLLQEIQASLTPKDREFLLSFKRGDPDWSLFPVATLHQLPAVQWKLRNINELKKNPKKHAEQLDALEKSLSDERS